MRRLPLFFFLVIQCFFSKNTILAHGPVHEEIVRLTEVLEQHPDSILLYFERGALFQIDEDLDGAVADFKKVLTLNPTIHSAVFQLAKLHLKQEKLPEAIVYINRYLDHHSADAVAYQLRGEIYLQQQKNKLAIADFQQVVTLKHDQAKPEDIARLAHLLSVHQPEKAIQVLEKGLRLLGPTISLQSQLVDLTITTQALDKAFVLVNQILITAPRKEFWLLKKAEIYEAIGDCQNAKKTYRHSLAEIASLKKKTKQTDFVQQIQQQAQLALNTM